jgi:hypothetical protein
MKKRLLMKKIKCDECYNKCEWWHPLIGIPLLIGFIIWVIIEFN